MESTYLTKAVMLQERRKQELIRMDEVLGNSSSMCRDHTPVTSSFTTYPTKGAIPKQKKRVTFEQLRQDDIKENWIENSPNMYITCQNIVVNVIEKLRSDEVFTGTFALGVTLISMGIVMIIISIISMLINESVSYAMVNLQLLGTLFVIFGLFIISVYWFFTVREKRELISYLNEMLNRSVQPLVNNIEGGRRVVRRNVRGLLPNGPKEV